MGRSRSPRREVRSTTDSGGVSGAAVYESSRAVDEYLQFHFASDAEMLPYGADIAPTAALGFTRRCAELTLAAKGRSRALDIGCAVGGVSMELAKHFDAVVGVDFSHAFVAAAQKIRDAGSHDYTARVEANITETRTATVQADVDRSRVSFEQGDACALREDLGTFDAVLAGNLLCRLPDPLAFLERAVSLVNPGGVLVLVSPYSWLEEYTPKEKWLGGCPGKPRSIEVVSMHLEALGLELVERRDMPFLMREHARKFQLGFSDGSVWRRKPTPISAGS